MVAKQSKTPKILIDYDANADVLYISFDKSRPGIARETDDENLIRIDPYTDEIVGVMIRDFKKRHMVPKTSNIEKVCQGFNS